MPTIITWWPFATKQICMSPTWKDLRCPNSCCSCSSTSIGALCLVWSTDDGRHEARQVRNEESFRLDLPIFQLFRRLFGILIRDGRLQMYCHCLHFPDIYTLMSRPPEDYHLLPYLRSFFSPLPLLRETGIYAPSISQREPPEDEVSRMAGSCPNLIPSEVGEPCTRQHHAVFVPILSASDSSYGPT